MNIDQALARLRVSRRTIYYLMARGILTYTPGRLRSRHIPDADVERYAQTHPPRRRRRSADDVAALQTEVDGVHAALDAVRS